MTEITIYYVQRAMTPKAEKNKVKVLCSASCLIVVNISVEFHENISNGFHVRGRTLLYNQNYY